MGQNQPSAPGTERVTDRLWTHPEAVRARYGAHGDALQDGPSVYAFRQPAIDWIGYLLDSLALSGGEVVLDAGCGRGAYLPHIAQRLGTGGRLVGLDFSPHMIRLAMMQTPAVQVLVGDVQSLPFADASFDVVLSAHMLYHVPDIRAALSEFRRVLRPAGMLAIIVGSARDERELDALFVAAGGAFPLGRYTDRFTADNAPAYLDGIFSRVERQMVCPTLVITDPTALTTYFASLRTIAEAALRPGVTWEAFVRALERMAIAAIAREGAVRVSEELAIIMCQ